MPSTPRILVLAPNWLGDAVMALPAIAAIRAAHPGRPLVVAGRASTVPLFMMVRGVEAVVRLDSRGGLVGAVSWAEDAAALRSAQADLAILFPNSFRSAWTTHRAGIPERWGYAADLRGRLLTRRVPRLRGPFHQADYYLHLVSALGFPADAAGRPRLPQLEPPAEAHARADELLARLGVGRDAMLVGLAPGAAYGKAKQWPPDSYGRLAADLHERAGVTSLVFGAKADAMSSGIVSRIAASKLQIRQNAATPDGRPAVLNLAGKTDLPLLVALMARCRAVVSNDSGAMHVAAAAGVPVTAVFGASDERGTAPLSCDTANAPAHEILASHAWCRPCMLRECPIDHRCMRGIEPGQVADAVLRQIAN